MLPCSHFTSEKNFVLQICCLRWKHVENITQSATLRTYWHVNYYSTDLNGVNCSESY